VTTKRTEVCQDREAVIDLSDLERLVLAAVATESCWCDTLGQDGSPSVAALNAKQDFA